MCSAAVTPRVKKILIREYKRFELTTVRLDEGRFADGRDRRLVEEFYRGMMDEMMVEHERARESYYKMRESYERQLNDMRHTISELTTRVSALAASGKVNTGKLYGRKSEKSDRLDKRRETTTATAARITLTARPARTKARRPRGTPQSPGMPGVHRAIEYMRGKMREWWEKAMLTAGYRMIDEAPGLIGCTDEDGNLVYRKKYIWSITAKVLKLMIYEEGSRGVKAIRPFLERFIGFYTTDGYVCYKVFDTTDDEARAGVRRCRSLQQYK